MKNKIVIFSNIKGGVGKTTLCALFANHLIEHGFPSFVIDADLQASLFRHRQREKDAAPDAQIPWNVEMLDTSDHKRLVQVMGKLKEVPGHRTDRLSGKPERPQPGIHLPISGYGNNTHIIRRGHCGRHRHIRQGSEVGVISRPDFHPQPNQRGREEGGRDTATGTDPSGISGWSAPLHRW